jgi:tetratricopeptide (TPR) repeat protein
MAKKPKADQTDKSLGGIESALTRSEQFIEDNQKILTNVLIGILALVLLVIAGNRYIIKPRGVEAASGMYMAERLFERDSFNLALYGYGTYPGFLDIMDDYSFTKSARLAKYYAGICYKELGDYESAIDMLSRFKTRDLLVGATAMSSLGDAYAESGEFEKAIRSYLSAVAKYENEFTAPIILKKAGIVSEEMGDLDQALEIYQRIEREYPDSAEGREIKKYIGRVEGKLLAS